MERLNNQEVNVSSMEVKQVVMASGNVYDLLWDETRITKGEYHLLDLKKGWVKINRAYISEEYSLGKLKKHTPLQPQIKALIEKYYGEEAYVE